MVRAFTRGARFAIADLRFEWVTTLCMVFALAAIFAPLFILLGLQKGIVGTMLDRMRGDPTNLEVRQKWLLNPGVNDDWITALRAREDVGWVTPNFGKIARRVGISIGQGTVDANLNPSGSGDPLLGRNGVDAPNEGEIVISASVAEKVGAKVGDRVTIQVRRSDLDAEVSLRVCGVAPNTVSFSDEVWVPLSLVRWVSSYVDGMEVPELGWKGATLKAEPSFDGAFVISTEEIVEEMKPRLLRTTGFDDMQSVEPRSVEHRIGLAIASDGDAPMPSADQPGDNTPPADGKPKPPPAAESGSPFSEPDLGECQDLGGDDRPEPLPPEIESTPGETPENTEVGAAKAGTMEKSENSNFSGDKETPNAVASPNHYSLFKVKNRSVDKEQIRQLKSRLVEEFGSVAVLPWVENLEVIIAQPSGKESSYQVAIIKALSEEPGGGGELDATKPQPLFVSPNSADAIGQSKRFRFESGESRLGFDCQIAEFEVVVDGFVVLEPKLAGILRAAQDAKVVFVNGSPQIEAKEKRYAAFRAYARSLEDLEGLVDYLEGERIEVTANLSGVLRIRQMSTYMTQLYTLIAAVLGVAAFLAIAANLYGNVQRKKGALAYLQLLGSTRIGLLWYPILKSLFLVILGIGFSLLAFWIFGQAVDRVMVENLREGESFVKLGWRDIESLGGSVLGTAAVASVLAALAVLRIDPSEAMRNE